LNGTVLDTERLHLRRWRDDDLDALAEMPAVEIGWRLARPFWGCGYASEAATEAMKFGFESCGLQRLISIRHVDNTRSARVMEKLGMRHAFDTVVPHHEQPVAVHALSKEEYQARR
jgi:RimJ/RimL family protein N-acetyltransferase